MASLKRALAPLVTACVAFAAGVSPAFADFPERAMRIIVPYEPGNSTDAISRAFADEVAKSLGVPVTVENRSGAGTALGTQAAKNAPADGYTILFGSSTMVSTVHALKKPGYELKDFVPVSIPGVLLYVLMTPANLPKDIPSYVDYAKKNPDKMNFGMIGTGAAAHSLSVRFSNSAGFSWKDIPYRGGAPAVTALISGDIQGYFSPLPSALTHVKNPKLHILGVAHTERLPQLPDVPTFKEAGYPEVVEENWYAFFVRSETPKPVVDKLRSAFAAAMSAAPIQRRLQQDGLAPYKGRLEDFPAKLEADSRAKREEMQKLGITPQ